TMVCFHTYFKPWLMRYLNLPAPAYTAVLGEDIQFKKPLSYHVLASLKIMDGSLVAYPVTNSGSGDLVHLAHADAVVSLPPDKEYFHTGEVYPITPFGKIF